MVGPLLAGVALVLGSRLPDAVPPLLLALLPLLPGLPRTWGETTAPPLLAAVAVASLGAALARRLGDGEPSPLPASVWRWGGAFLVVALASALASTLRGETLYLLLRGGADPLFVNSLWMPAADRSRDALRLFSTYAVLLLSLDAFARAAGSPGRRDGLLRVLAASSTVGFLVALLEPRLPFALSFFPWSEMSRRLGLFSDPNALGLTLGLVVPLLAATVVSKGPRATRALAVLALALSPLALERSGSRTGLLLLGVAGLVFGVGLFRRSPRSRGPLAALAAVLVVVAFVLARRAPRSEEASIGGLLRRLSAALTTRSLEDLTSHRTLFWQAALEVIVEEPLSGCGLGGFGYEYPVRFERKEGKRAEFTDNATNALLDVAAECGLPGLALALATVIPLLVLALDSALGTGPRDALARASGATLAGFAVASLTGSHVRFPEVALAVSFVAALSVSGAAAEDEGSVEAAAPAAGPRVRPIVVGSGVLASLLTVLETLSPETAFRAGPWVGVYGWESRGDTNVRRWMGPRAFRQVLPDETRLSFLLRNQRPDSRPVLVVADVDGGPASRTSLPPGETREVTVDLPPGARVVRLRLNPSFVPDGGGRRDTRTLSVLLLGTPDDGYPKERLRPYRSGGGKP